MGTVDFERIYGQDMKQTQAQQHHVMVPLENIEELTPDPKAGVMWTYQRLARTQAIIDHCSALATQLRIMITKASTVARQICLMVDNSGSMGFFHKPVYVAEAIVIFCETM